MLRRPPVARAAAAYYAHAAPWTSRARCRRNFARYNKGPDSQLFAVTLHMYGLDSGVCLTVAAGERPDCVSQLVRARMAS